MIPGKNQDGMAITFLLMSGKISPADGRRRECVQIIIQIL